MTTKMKAIYFDEFNRIGKTYMPRELVKEVNLIAKELKISRSSLIRRISEAYIMYHHDAKSLGKVRMFTHKVSVTDWLEERNEIENMTNQILKITEEIKECKNPGDQLQLIAKQNAITAVMINLLHKTTMT